MIFRHPRLIAILILLVVLSGLAGSAWLLIQPAPMCIQGEVEATKANVSAKVPGRIEEMRVEEGQHVAKGDVIAILDSPQLEAKRQQAQGAHSAASAQRDKAEHGAREEQIRMAYNQWQQALAGLDFAQKSFARVDRLFQDGIVPAQQRDEVKAKLEMTLKLAATAEAQYDMAVNGAREEDKAAAAALVEQAQGAVNEVDSYLEEARVRAPMDGEIVEYIVNVGELAASGMPIVTMVDLDDVWVTFNMREDHLAGLKIGEHLKGTVPALNHLAIEMEVTYISALGDFAAWRATSASGGFDLRTFEVRTKSVEAVDGLRPGMSVIVPWDRVPPPDPLAWVRDLIPWEI
ncbi:MAG TPA: efflux RND transporter periplasmic adaptor subunit [Candidatus Hydrogenedentes bacterium]|nr:efflux RND transporter periplasmic adaptor subunit [Candidatus Hydrogenedentota bacterium]HPG67631.1 efflux RND transporter periplasmic adaptor subunit [Candidatus Hydrogenedentota bacterium]